MHENFDPRVWNLFAGLALLTAGCGARVAGQDAGETGEPADTNETNESPESPESPDGSECIDASERGRAVFEAEGCDVCHTPPLYTASEPVELERIGTDSAAGASPARGTGSWRVPSLRGVGGNAPYLHHGAFATLEAMFEPGRDEPGHEFGLGLTSDERADLIAFLRTI